MIGRRIDKYRIMEEIGHGGMAVVYKAEDEHLKREVALKIMHAHLAREAEAVKRFRREATTVARLRHANIIEIFDYSGEGSDVPYIVTELIQAGTLADLSKRQRVLPEEVAAIIALFIARALDHAHKQGIVHRDLKPENVMFHLDGALKLMDFGIARALEEMSMTMTGTLVGSPVYMSPEQATGQKIDPRSDLFSLGTILYEICCGQLPFDGDSPPLILRRIYEGVYDDPQMLRPEMTNRFAAILRRLLRNDVAQRYQSAAELLKDLEDYLATTLIEDPEGELRRLLLDSDSYLKEFNGRLVVWLEEKARSLSKRKPAEAAQLYNRLLLVKPDHAEANTHLQALLTRRRWEKRLAYFGAFAAAAAFLIIAAVQLRNHNDLLYGLFTPPDTDEEILYSEVNYSQADDSPPTGITPIDGAPPSEAKAAVAVESLSKPVLLKPKNTIRIGALKKIPGKGAAIAGADFSGTLRVHTMPWSDIYVDGRKVGQYPLDASTVFPLQLPAGKHRVRMVNPSCVPLEKTVEIVRPDQSIEIRERLELLPAMLSIGNSQKAMLFIAGEFKGYTPFSKPLEIRWPEQVSEKSVEISLRKEGFVTETRRVKLKAGQSTEVRFELRKL